MEATTKKPARAYCQACDPGTSSKAFIVTVTIGSDRHYFYFDLRFAAQGLMDRVDGARTPAEAQRWVDSYRSMGFHAR